MQMHSNLPREIKPFRFEHHGAGLALIYVRAFGQSGHGYAKVNSAGSFRRLNFQRENQTGRDLINQIQQEFTSGLVWQDKDGVVQGGVSIVSHPLRADTGIITNLVVDERFRQQGIGRALVTGAIDIVRRSGAKHLALQVDHDNTAAIRLYESLNFQTIGEVTYFEYKRTPSSVSPIQLRRAIYSDTDELQRLARLAFPESLGYGDVRDEKQFSPNHGNWLVLDGADHKLAAAISSQAEDHQTRTVLLMNPKTSVDSGIGTMVAAMTGLQGEITLVLSTHALTPLRMATACGFVPVRALRHMRLDLA